GEDTTLLYLGVNRWNFWNQEDLEAFDDFAAKGGRIVISFRPIAEKPSALDEAQQAPTPAPRKKSKKKKQPPREEMQPLVTSTSFAQHWGATLEYLKPGEDA